MCARCERLVWLEPDGSRSDYGLYPLKDSEGQVAHLQGIGGARSPHQCLQFGDQQQVLPPLPRATLVRQQTQVDDQDVLSSLGLE